MKNQFDDNALTKELTDSPRSSRRWFPHPMFSLGMVFVWMLLNNNLDVGQLVLGLFFGWVIPWLTQSFWPEPLKLHKPLLALRFGVTVLSDVIVANLILAKRILGPIDKLQPAFVKVPLDIDDEFAIAMLASTISLTPGTVSADLSMDGRYLLVHCLHVPDVDDEIHLIKTRYEAPIKEIFNC